jgi:crossover junction endodeoxyribonuclease RuvC
MLVLGIDPGLDGALAFYDGTTLRVYDMPAVQARTKGRELDCSELARLVDAAGHIKHCYLEQAWPRPNEASSRAAKQGGNWGVVRGVVAAHFIPTTIVSPQKWTKALAVQKGKDASRARASELLPAYSALWQRKRDDGRAEAALIALYGWRQLFREAA